jgi:hypothetical protein
MSPREGPLLWLWPPGCDSTSESPAAGGCSTAGAADYKAVDQRTPSGVSQLRGGPQAATPNVVPGCNYTRAFVRLVVSLRPMMTIKGLRWLLLMQSENLNPERNEVQCLRRAAYGYRVQQYFILKPFALHEAKFEFLM